ncbi:MAG TPA: PQQ-dependent sugar dehydrogenase [Gemmataceae bacterium]|nr:PQQ-dependent sugar dehydrogenase [Gemmataceae bacterium]
MQRLRFLAVFFIGFIGGANLTTADPAEPPYGIDHRIPWTHSHVVGSPNPPPPFHVVRAFPKLTFNQPLYVKTEPGTDDMIVLAHDGGYEGPGHLFRLKNDPTEDKAQPFLDMNRIAYGVAFHPDYTKNGYIYVGSNGPDGEKVKLDRISRFTVARKPPYRCDPKSEVVILEWASNGHNGADLEFGPDGYLYVTSGDGTSDSDGDLRGQELAHLTAKVLRFDVDHPADGKSYSVPKDNPFVDRKGTAPETWAYGFRNPWRMTFDKKTGALWVAQNGQDLWEQAYVVHKGDNAGWSVMEGSHPFQPQRQRGPDPIVTPAVEHHHSEFRSLTGGVVYYGKKYPDLDGSYIYGDYSTGEIWAARHDGMKTLSDRELTDSRLQIVGFGLDPDGELLIVDHAGGLYTLEPTPKDENPPKFPTRLSETGIFTSVKGHVVAPGLIPYDVNAPLWSDGATKERYIGLPGDAQIEFTTYRGWNFPDATVLVKTFSLDAADAADKRRIETRLLTRRDGQWYGYSYLWNDEQTDADLVPAAGLDRTYEVRDLGRVRKQTWHYPSRAECMVCHSRAANWVLGLTEMQMNKIHEYPHGVRDEQLRTLEHLGVFKVSDADHIEEIKRRVADWLGLGGVAAKATTDAIVAPRLLTPPPVRGALAAAGRGLSAVYDAAPAPPDLLRPLEDRLRKDEAYTTLLPKRPGEYRRLADPGDRNADLDLRARSYLQSNCAQCHVLAGGGNSLMDLDFTTPKKDAHLYGAKPQHQTFGIADPVLIAPGEPDRSVLLQRISRRGPDQMPPLATARVDEEAVRMLRQWISAMKKED